MKHIQVKDLWLQKEVNDGRVIVSKVAGTENPADLMTKIWGIADIDERLKFMNLSAKWKTLKIPGGD